jgi:septal ring factor EnvC (AmiA/AmiB activator)
MTDIVNWLRSILHNDRSVELHCREAADEIERLREERDEAQAKYERIFKGLEGSCMSCEPVGVRNQQMEQHIKKLQAERDEARRSVCEMSLQLGQVFRRIGGKNVEVTTPEGCAEIMRWDCFKENKNA